VTKKDMAKAIADEMGLTQVQAREIVQRVFNGITETLLDEGRIELRNFGVFEVRKRKPRKARNPRTGGTCRFRPNWSSPSSLAWRWKGGSGSLRRCRADEGKNRYILCELSPCRWRGHCHPGRSFFSVYACA